MSHSPLEYLHHILDEATFLCQNAHGLVKEQFTCDETLKRAYVRSLEIIGEAAKKLPADPGQKYGEIDWRSMAGMRDRLIHDYFGVDYDLVWDVVQTKIPQLKDAIELILRKEG